MIDLMRVVGETDESPSPSGGGTASSPGWGRGRSGVGVGVPLALAVTGAAVAVALSLGSSAPAPRPETPSGRDILLATATAVDRRTGPATGRYWRVVKIGRSMLPAGRNVGANPVEVRMRDDIWLAGPGGRRSVVYRQCFGTRPLTPAERAAHLDRPSRAWPVDSAAAPICAAGSGPAVRNADLTAAADYRLADVAVSPIWLDHLSTEPAVLRRQVEAKLATAQQGGLGVFGHVVLPQLTSDLPLRPEIRAAVLRMMAGLPGVRAAGPVRDALGRTGEGVVISGLGLTTTELRWIVDPRGGGVLGVQEVATGRGRRPAGTVVAEKAYVSAGWTNDAPPGD
ncbi:hypothetical protein [Actinoallomurus rhizosphaericola]|uniref:hypothetical protein n=1 Tax=Actinoallomurus rhizosphaericola TaxID=2952536 RepID=UPI002092DB7A|nr:hypothetical protein [Actinoallomurus rhizosphaericola]MCO5997465.1 hypothetical protein [Actinoallomurus rhizosphaericola]